ncbi:hypothetical protein REPUB_Repub10bG0020400 [Reevesia pubescens]
MREDFNDEDDLVDIEEVEDLDDVEEIAYPDHAFSLLAQRSFEKLYLEDGDDWRRRNIFHTTCTSHGKVCKVIVDGGSFENIVSKEMVQKLNIETESHPIPYNLGWLQDKNKI